MRTADQTSGAAVREVLRMTGRARDMILDPGQTDRLREVIAEGNGRPSAPPPELLG